MERATELKPAAQLNNSEIVSEVRDLHSQFKSLSEEYNNAPATQRPQLREQMEPLVNREHELRHEYTGRATQEIKQDRVPELQIEVSR